MKEGRRRTELLYLALYAMMILALLATAAFGSRLYESVTQKRLANENRRGVLSTVVSAVQASDAQGAVCLKQGPEGTSLCLAQGDSGYEERFYLSEGVLYLQFCGCEAEFSPEDAFPVGNTNTFTVEAEEKALRIFTDEGSAVAALACGGGAVHG